MSPSEHELRAALHEGEGDSIDPSRVIARASGVRRAQRARHRQQGAIAATVVAIAGVITGGVVWGHSLRDNSSNAASSQSEATFGAAGGGTGAASAAGPAAGAAAAGTTAAGTTAAGGPIANGPLHDAAAAACPSTVPTVPTVPTVAAGSNTAGSLVALPIEAIKACAYVDGSHPLEATDGNIFNAIYIGATATEIATSLNDASPTPLPVPACKVVPGTGGYLTVLVPIDTDGRTGAPVVYEHQACTEQTVTNATTTRYGWTPPASMSTFLAGAQAAANGHSLSAPPPVEHGSPISS